MAWVNLTIQEYTVSGSPSSGPFSFSGILYLNDAIVPIESQFVVSVDGVIKTEGAANDYTISGENVTFTAGHGAIQVGETVRIARSTQDDARYVDWVDASRVLEADMDLDSNQLFFLIQEALDTAHSAMVKNLAGQWDAQNVTIQDLAPGVNSTDAVTLGQVNAIFGDGVPTNIDDGIVITYTGDSSTTAFTLTDVRNSATLQWFVWVDGIIQHGNYAVTNSAGVDDTLTFDVAPIQDAEILFHAVKGTVASSLDINSIDGTMIQDEAIDIDHLKFTAGDPQRFIEVDSAGDPTLVQLDHDDIQDFDDGVKANEWRAMAVPTAHVSLNSKKIQNLADGEASTDAVNKSQLDAAVGDAGFTMGSMAAWSPGISTNETRTITGASGKTLRGFIWSGTYVGVDSTGGSRFNKSVAFDGTGIVTDEYIEFVNDSGVVDAAPNSNVMEFRRVNSNRDLEITWKVSGAGEAFNNNTFILFRN